MIFSALVLCSLLVGASHARRDPGSDERLNSGQASNDKALLPDESLVALQTSPDGGLWRAGGMVLSKSSGEVYLSGTKYGPIGGKDPPPNSSCFFGVMLIPSLQWKQIKEFDDKDTCGALSGTTRFQENEAVVVVGSTTKNAEFGEASTVGFVLDLEAVNDSFELLGNTEIISGNAQYPVTAVTRDNQVWVVSMTSDDTMVARYPNHVFANEFPYFSTDGVEMKGNRFTVAIERYSLNRSAAAELDETLVMDWGRNLNEHVVMESFLASGMILVGDDLVIVGSIRGTSDEEMDGAMIKIESSDGSLASRLTSGRAVSILESSESRQQADWILSACVDPDNYKYFYIVGATKGRQDQSVDPDDDLIIDAIFAKIKFDSLTPVWTKKYSVKQAADGVGEDAIAASLGCAVVPGEELMYVAGVVGNSATIGYHGGPDDQVSAGGQDIFVSLVSTDDGATRWLRQAGSGGDESIARGGGIGVAADKNAVVYGDTTGSLFHNREDQDVADVKSDLFVMLFDYQDGAHYPPFEAIPPPVESLVSSNDSSKDFPQSTTEKSADASNYNMILLTIALFCLMAFFTFFCICTVLLEHWWHHARRKKLEQQSAEVFMRLKDFDIDDIDLRRSPPGGWHGIYLNKLKYGINRVEHMVGEDDSNNGSFSVLAEEFDVSRSSIASHSSVVRDSLFMDT